MNQSCLETNFIHLQPNQIVEEVVLRKMNGTAQSFLVGASDGKIYVLKLKNDPQGPNALFNEALGSVLAKSMGLAIPAWSPIRVDEQFVRENPILHFSFPPRVSLAFTGSSLWIRSSFRMPR
jgi:hypothetical protein